MKVCIVLIPALDIEPCLKDILYQISTQLAIQHCLHVYNIERPAYSLRSEWDRCFNEDQDNDLNIVLSLILTKE